MDRGCGGLRAVRASSHAADARALRARVSQAKTSGRLAKSALLGVRQDAAFRQALSSLILAATAGRLPVRSCADTLWAVGALHADTGAMTEQMEALATALCACVDKDLRGGFDVAVGSLADAAFALASGRHVHRGMFDRLLSVAALRTSPLGSAGADTVCTLLYASAVLCDPAQGVTAAVAQVIAAAGPRLSTWKPRQLALALWSLAVADLETSEAFARCWDELCHRAENVAAKLLLSPLALTQLAQASFSAPSGLPPLPERLHSAMHSAWVSRVDVETQKASRPSARQRQMEAALRSLGMRLTAEAVVPPFGYRVDFSTLTASGTAVLVEYDGHAHFPRNLAPPCAPLGATRLKRKHLLSSGHRLLSVPYYDWETDDLAAQFSGDVETRRVEYLRKHLQAFDN